MIFLRASYCVNSICKLLIPPYFLLVLSTNNDQNCMLCVKTVINNACVIYTDTQYKIQIQNGPVVQYAMTAYVALKNVLNVNKF